MRPASASITMPAEAEAMRFRASTVAPPRWGVKITRSVAARGPRGASCEYTSSAAAATRPSATAAARAAALQERDFLVEVRVDPVDQPLSHGFAPAVYQAPICARSASVIPVMFASGIAFSWTACW